MDHAGDFIRYINEGLKVQGFSGMLDDSSWIQQDRNNAVMIVWGKDAQAKITIEVGSFGYPDDGT